MPRPRATLALAAICLVAGPLATFLVAWSCALWATVAYDPQDPAGFTRPDDAGLVTTYLNFSGFGLRDTRFETSSESDYYQRRTLRHAAGWPIAALSTVSETTDEVPYIYERRGQSYPSVTNARTLEPGIEPPAWLARAFYSAAGTRPPLPLHPMARGFLIDSFFYAALTAAALLIPSAARRSRRRRRGLCPACAYDLGGLATDHPCPECGGARS